MNNIANVLHLMITLR